MTFPYHTHQELPNFAKNSQKINLQYINILQKEEQQDCFGYTVVLGFGDISPEAALPVMEGKAILFKEFGGVDAFPIVLDTKDPDEITKTVKYLAPTFGGINLEDISSPLFFEIEERLKANLDIPVFHDDQHGTAMVSTAGIINPLKIIKKE